MKLPWRKLETHKVLDINRRPSAPLCGRTCPLWSSELSLRMEYLHCYLPLKFLELLCSHSCNVLPSEILPGRFTTTPHHRRLCPCGRRRPESVAYILFYCEFYDHVWDSLVSSLLFKQHECPGESLVLSVTIRSASFYHMYSCAVPFSCYAD